VQYHAQCTTANILTCVPACNATRHGYELLATIGGTDTTFSCNLANLLYSWIGAAALGGFLGHNVAAFVSAVISGAAGTYVLTLVEDADVSIDLVFQPGQHVIISGDLYDVPSWGTGGFTVMETGSLAMAGVALGGNLEVHGGTNVTITGGVIDGLVSVQGDGILCLKDAIVLPSQVTTTPSATVTRESTAHGLAAQASIQCARPYITLSDAWRSSTTGGVHNSDDSDPGGPTHIGTCVGGGRWYRFIGTGGDALARSAPVRPHHCASTPGWMSGWDATIPGPSPCCGSPRNCPTGAVCTSYTGVGSYPVALEGVVEKIFCYRGTNGG
jgi:hypothetical protein